jgi:hypothetical protein
MKKKPPKMSPASAAYANACRDCHEILDKPLTKENTRQHLHVLKRWLETQAAAAKEG